MPQKTHHNTTQQNIQQYPHLKTQNITGTQKTQVIKTVNTR